MKVLISIDQLVYRDNTTNLVEHLLAIFPDAVIATICHRKHLVSGRVETHPIYSTYLSNIVKNLEDFKKVLPLIPGAVKNLKIPGEFDLHISVSNGFCHGIEAKAKNKAAYIYQWNNLISGSLPLLSKLSLSYVNKWRLNKLKSIQNINFSTQALAWEIGFTNASVIAPFVTGEKIFFEELSLTKKNKPAVLILTYNFDQKLEEKLIELSKLEVELKFLGANHKLIQKYNGEYGGEINFETLSHYGKIAEVIFDNISIEYPECGLLALACGRYLLVADSKINREVFAEDYGILYSVKEINFDTLRVNFPDHRKIRRISLKYNGRIFKSRFLKWLKIQDT